MLRREQMQQPPNILFLQLLRFERKNNVPIKLNNDVSPSASIFFFDKLYRLKAIIEHHGYSMDVGHYKSVIYSNNKCVVYNDDEIENEEHNHSTGYIYIYMSL